MTTPRYEVDPRKCIRCAACASVAPDLFAVDQPTARVVRDPQGEEEERSCESALLLCPTGALRRFEAPDGA